MIIKTDYAVNYLGNFTLNGDLSSALQDIILHDLAFLNCATFIMCLLQL